MHDFVTTLDYPSRPEWASRGRSLTADAPSPAVRLRRILASSGARRPIVLDGFNRADTIAATLIATTRRPAPVVMTDCTWKVGRSPADRLLTRTGIRALDGPRTTFCVSSTAEREIFPSLWDVPPAHVRICRWYHGLTDEQLALPVSEDGPIFSGGRSLRDYEPLLRCAARLPERIHIAADRDDLPRGVPVPDNVEVGPTSHEGYLEAMRGAALVVVALEPRSDRSAGQTTYLNAMALGKLTVVTDTLGVSDHIEDRVSGLVVPGHDPDALETTIRWALDPVNADAVAAIRAHGREVARTRFGPEQHIEALLAVVDEVLER